jgi:hypothetical protein
MTEVFQMVPAPGRAFGVIAAIGVLLLALVALFAVVAWGGRTTRFQVTDDGLRIRSPIYGRTVPFDDIIPGSIRVADLRTDRELQPTLRTNGLGLPGYSAGWFRLRGGRRALLFVTVREQVVHFETRGGHAVQLSAQAPDELTRALSRHLDGG